MNPLDTLRAMKLGSNPIAARLTRTQGGFPTIGQAIAIALGLGFFSILLSAATFIAFRLGFGSTITALLVVTGWLTTLTLSSFIARGAAALASQDAREEGYELFRITTIEASTRIWGYILAALHRARLSLALVAGLMPLIILGTALFGFAVQARLFTTARLENIEVRTLVQFVKLTGMALGIWGTVPLGAALGAGFGLWWRNHVTASYAASFMTSILVLGIALSAILLPLPQVVLAVLAFILAPVPWVLTLFGVRWAERFTT